MAKKKTINIGGKEISILSQANTDYISLTDMARSQLQDVVIIKWLSLKSTIEYLGEWEALYNLNFNYTDFGTIRNSAGSNNFVYANEADLLNVALFGNTAKKWKEQNPDAKGNMRDEASIEQLIVLSNMESINALLIEQELPQKDRLVQLNKVAIMQMKSILANESFKKLGD